MMKLEHRRRQFQKSRKIVAIALSSENFLCVVDFMEPSVREDFSEPKGKIGIIQTRERMSLTRTFLGR